MRIAFLSHPKGIRVPINPDNIWTDSRGLTGSEIAFFRFGIELARFGHDVTIFTSFKAPGNIENAKCLPYEVWEAQAHNESWDIAYASTIADPLKLANASTFKFLNHQCKGFGTSVNGWESYVDMLAPLSSSHARELLPDTNFPKEKWRVLFNGVDTSKFYPSDKVPGKMIWASSLDRGFHWLLEIFPEICRKVPEASLHVFYDFHSIEHMAAEYYPGKNRFYNNENFELGARSRYILEVLKKLEGKGVHVHKSVSRERMEYEMRTSSILAYPLDPIYYTETFGVVVLEACASGTAPILCAADAFGELWGPVAETVPAPYREHKAEFLEKTIRCLSDREHRERVANRCVQYAKKFEWSELARGLETCLQSRGERGLPNVSWSVP